MGLLILIIRNALCTVLSMRGQPQVLKLGNVHLANQFLLQSCNKCGILKVKTVKNIDTHDISLKMESAHAHLLEAHGVGNSLGFDWLKIGSRRPEVVRNHFSACLSLMKTILSLLGPLYPNMRMVNNFKMFIKLVCIIKSQNFGGTMIQYDIKIVQSMCQISDQTEIKLSLSSFSTEHHYPIIK